jgi:hypothetical protein
MPIPPLERRLSSLFRGSRYPTASVGGMGIPTKRPMLENVIRAGRAKNTLVRNVIDTEFVGVENRTLCITFDRHTEPPGANVFFQRTPAM